jgi:hypothetical protein
MKNFLPLSAFLFVAVLGCGEAYDPNLAKNPTTAEVNAAKDRRSEMIAIYKKVNGNWDSMTPEDKATILKYSAGDEPMARKGWPLLGKMAE